MNAFHVFGYEAEGNMGDTSADRPRISIATDLSLDEGAIIRTEGAGASPLSGGTEYFVNLQQHEAQLVADALNAYREQQDMDYHQDDIDMVASRVERLLGYIHGS
jgi:hypothetical protein